MEMEKKLIEANETDILSNKDLFDFLIKKIDEETTTDQIKKLFSLFQNCEKIINEIKNDKKDEFTGIDEDTRGTMEKSIKDLDFAKRDFKAHKNQLSEDLKAIKSKCSESLQKHSLYKTVKSPKNQK